MGYDFEGLASHLLDLCPGLLYEWLPGGKLAGCEYVCAGIMGGLGTSMKVNFNTGKYADFADGSISGRDLINLYSQIKKLPSQVETYKQLSNLYNFNSREEEYDKKKEIKQDYVACIPPKDSFPNMKHYKFGEALFYWTYKTKEGEPLFYVARYLHENEKQYIPFTFSAGKWNQKSHQHPRPLFNLDKIVKSTNPILVCEGEKACVAAESFCGKNYTCTTWSGGSKAVANTDWSPLRNRTILIWEDADDAGRLAREKLITLIKSKRISYINVSDCQHNWDAADSNFTEKQFKDWVKDRIIGIAHEENVSIEGEGPTLQELATTNAFSLAVNGAGKPIVNVDNICRILQTSPDYKDKVWGDVFYGDVLTTIDCKTPRFWTDKDTLLLNNIIQRKYGIATSSSNMCWEAVCTIAAMNEKNEPQDWCNSLVWDKTPRLENFLPYYMGANNTLYNQKAGKNWFIGIAARILCPGIQMDNQLILKSKQGGGVHNLRGKTSALRAIGGKWYTSSGRDILSRHFHETIQGKIIVEIGELVGFSRAEVESVKDAMTTTTDRYRVSYGKKASDHPRTCVFAATTNERTPLRDNTGNRRFWCIDVASNSLIKVKEIENDREQLFAEAVYYFKKWQETKDEEYSWWLMPVDETAEIEEMNRECDPWEDIIDRWLEQSDETTTLDIARNLLFIDIEKYTKSVQMRIGGCLNSLGWVNVTRRNGRLQKFWIREKYPQIENTRQEEEFEF